MKKLNTGEEHQYLRILSNLKKYLFSFYGVHYIDIGYKFTLGKILPELSIRVHLYRKVPKQFLSISQIIPQFIDSIPVDIIQSNPGLHYFQSKRRERFDPLVGGISIRNLRYNTQGTLGMIVRDIITGKLFALSNYHVLVGEAGKKGDLITQPATDNKDDIIGEVNRWNEQFDCAVCELNNSRRPSAKILGYDSPPNTVIRPSIGMIVTKSGLTTGITTGIIDGISFDDFTIIPKPKQSLGDIEISAPGDSGSIWLETNTNAAVGLHYAGEIDPRPEAERAWAKRLHKIFRVLHIDFM
ncbi:MAG TPA: hypothetical protein PLZ08_08255 [Bacillota bacterium]|jgi:hypothetical protein|nr:hypothetical protein [Bacillota bacterium]HOL10185.1 hypothetical protein [Bacillota bacterium]HPO97937.1 hypothetical protein [Bacillota bacterium]